jgi:hypothetical protein
MPVIAEMKTPKSFKKSLFTSQGFLVACYVSFALVVYTYVFRHLVIVARSVNLTLLLAIADNTSLVPLWVVPVVFSRKWHTVSPSLASS